MRRLVAPAMLVLSALAVLAQEPGPRAPYESADPPLASNAVDRAVFGALKAQGVTPARLSSDAVFVRRVYLDVIGTLPTADEAFAKVVT